MAVVGATGRGCGDFQRKMPKNGCMLKLSLVASVHARMYAGHDSQRKCLYREKLSRGQILAKGQSSLLVHVAFPKMNTIYLEEAPV